MEVAPELLARARLSHGLARLCASLAVADAPLNREEYAAFRALFPMPSRRDLRVRGWLDEGSQRPIPPEQAAGILLPLFTGRPEMLEEILARFVALAWADGGLHEGELRWLRACARGLCLPPELLGQLLEDARPDSAGSENPYALFGLTPDATLGQVKRSWQRKLRAFHPDALAARGMDVEDQRQFGRRMTEINAAYDQILRLRGVR